MPVVMVIAVVVILVAVFLAARGRGDRLSAERSDYAPLDLGPVTATDVVLLRPPAGMWGYDMAATDDALEQIAESIRERDVRIVALEQLVTDLSRDQAPAIPLGSPYEGARHRRDAAEPAGEYPAGSYATTESYPTKSYPAESYPAQSYPAPDPAGPEPADPGPAVTELPRAPWEIAETPWESTNTEASRLPFDPGSVPGRPGGEAAGPPPERSHD